MAKPDEASFFHATTAEGLVDLLLEEIQGFGLTVQSQNRGGVFFTGELSSLVSFFYSTRVSSRVGLVLKEFRAQSPDELYKESSKIPWEDILPKNSYLRIDSNTKDSLPHSQFAGFRLKDAILDRFRKLKLTPPNVEKDIQASGEFPKRDIHQRILLYLRSSRDQASIEVSISPDSFSHRGYRLEAGEAPIREHLAQAMLVFSGWKGHTALVDPMCGTGTILIEAAIHLKEKGQIHKNKLESSLFFQSWKDSINWEESSVQSEPISSQNNLQPNGTKPILLGLEKDIEALELAKANARKAGVEDWIRWKCISFQEESLSSFSDLPWTVVTNPPYGIRLGNKESSAKLFQVLGEWSKVNAKGGSLTLITGDTSLLGPLKLKEEKSLKVRNAKLMAKIAHYTIRGKDRANP